MDMSSAARVLRINCDLGNLIGQYLLLQNSQKSINEVYSNQSKLNRSYIAGIQYGLKQFTILVISSHTVTVYKSDKSLFVQFQLNSQSDLASLKDWAYDYSSFIKELHFMDGHEIPIQIFQAVHALKGLRVLNFAIYGVPEQFYFRDLIQNNAHGLEIMRNCQNASLGMPRELLERLVWIGSYCGGIKTLHYYRTNPLADYKAENGICYDLVLAHAVHGYHETVSGICSETANAITHFNILFLHWEYFLHFYPESKIRDFVRSIRNVKSDFPNLRKMNLTLIIDHNCFNRHPEHPPYIGINHMLACAKTMMSCLQQTGQFFTGLEVCFKISYQIVYYYDEESQLPRLKFEMDWFRGMMKANSDPIASTMQWNVEDTHMSGVLIVNNAQIEVKYSLVKRTGCKEYPGDPCLQNWTMMLH